MQARTTITATKPCCTWFGSNNQMWFRPAVNALELEVKHLLIRSWRTPLALSLNLTRGKSTATSDWPLVSVKRQDDVIEYRSPPFARSLARSSVRYLLLFAIFSSPSSGCTMPPCGWPKENLSIRWLRDAGEKAGGAVSKRFNVGDASGY